MEDGIIIDKISKYTRIPSDAIKQKIRNKAISNVISHLEKHHKTPFDLGEEEFEVVVADEEQKIIVKLSKWIAAGGVALSFIATMIGLE